MMTNQPELAMRLPFWRQLRWNLIIYFVLLAVVPIFVVQVVTLSQVSDSGQRQIFNQLESIVELKSSQIQYWFSSGHAILDVLISEGNRYNRWVEFIQAPTETENAVVSGLLHETLSPSVDDQSRANVLEGIDELFLYDLRGRVLASSDVTQIGKVVNQQPYFEPSLKTDYIQPPYYLVSGGALAMYVTEPLYGENRQVVGVLAAKLNTVTLSQIMLGRSGLGDTGETYLVSAESSYLLTPSRFEGYEERNRAYRSEGIDKALSGQNGRGIYGDYRNPPVQVLGVYRWMPELQAAMVAEIAVAEGLATSTQVLTSSTLIAVLAALVAVVIGLLRITQISRPIGALTRVATNIAAGDRTLRADIPQRNEIGLMAQAFNQMTNELARNIKALDLKVEEINQANRELQVATARAREAARVKGEFLANVSHELRTPLNAIIGFSDMLLLGMSGPLNDKQIHKLTRLKENGARLLALINDLLDLTRIESGRLEMVQKPFEPRALIHQMVAQMEGVAAQTRLEFKSIVDPDLPRTLSGDEQRLQQVLVNLLSNAFKFTKEGSVTLEARFSADEKTWSLLVRDTGIGVPPHALNLIFEEFRQLDGSYSRAYKGSGLGLAITRNLVRMMDGKISVKSALGEGSTFTVVLPIAQEEPAHLVLEGAQL